MGVKGKIVEIFKTTQGEGKYVGLPQIFLRLSLCNLQCTYCDTDFVSGNWMDASEVLQEVESLLHRHPDVESLSVTGGEPLLQDAFLLEMLPQLKEVGIRQRCTQDNEHAFPPPLRGRSKVGGGQSRHTPHPDLPPQGGKEPFFKEGELRTLLETNGTLPDHLKKVLPWVDIVSMDIKLASASLTPDVWSQHEAFLALSRAKDTYVKVVLSEATTDEDFSKAVGLVSQADPRICFVLQPVTPMGQAVQPRAAQMKRWMEMAKEALVDVRLIPQMHRVWGIA